MPRVCWVSSSARISSTRRECLSLPKPRRCCCACSSGGASGTCLPPAASPCDWSTDGKPQPPHGPKSLEEWKQFWGARRRPIRWKAASDFKAATFSPGLAADLDQLTPEDFRLRPDSAGYRAGKDGKDLGADVDLVGPGPAYERWKKTPEYQAVAQGDRTSQVSTSSQSDFRILQLTTDHLTTAKTKAAGEALPPSKPLTGPAPPRARSCAGNDVQLLYRRPTSNRKFLMWFRTCSIS